MYLFYGEETFYFKKGIKKIIKETKSQNVISFEDFSNLQNSLMEIISIIETIDLFTNKKILIIKNFEEILDKKHNEKLKLLLSSLKQKDNNIIVIFTFEFLQKFNNSTFEKFAKKWMKIKECKKVKIKNLSFIIEKLVKENDGKISSEAIYKVINKLPNNLNIIESEIKKMLNFSKEINGEIVEQIITSYNSEDVFEFTNGFQNNNLSILMKIYKEKMIEDIKIPLLINEITLVISLSLKVYSLLIKKYNEQEIATKLNIHPFRIKKSIELIKNLGENKLEVLALKLANLEYKIKTYQINDKHGFETFLINATNN